MPDIEVRSSSRSEMIDITEQVSDILEDGHTALLISSPHTTCGITVNEGYDPAVQEDMLAKLDDLVPQETWFRHSEGNSDAHIKTSLIGTSQLIPLRDGKLALGRWQRIFLAEFDGPRTRNVRIEMM
ncbi:MAG: secondary thiamine-phosphate synthase enzyme YjbQ [Nanoarchaeota archaeon]